MYVYLFGAHTKSPIITGPHTQIYRVVKLLLFESRNPKFQYNLNK